MCFNRNFLINSKRIYAVLKTILVTIESKYSVEGVVFVSTITEQALEELSPFELSLFLEQKIHENKNVTNLLNAGRGNPNWTAPNPREAFFLLGQFATQETLYGTGELTCLLYTSPSPRDA